MSIVVKTGQYVNLDEVNRKFISEIEYAMSHDDIISADETLEAVKNILEEHNTTREMVNEYNKLVAKMEIMAEKLRDRLDDLV